MNERNQLPLEQPSVEQNESSFDIYSYLSALEDSISNIQSDNNEQNATPDSAAQTPLSSDEPPTTNKRKIALGFESGAQINRPTLLDSRNPLINPKNELRFLTNPNIAAVFKESGQAIPNECKVCWTKQLKSDPRHMTGFVIIENQKYIVISETFWNKEKAWMTPDGKQLTREAYDHLIRIDDDFFIEQIMDDNSVKLVPLTDKHAFFAKKRSKEREVVALEIPEELDISTVSDNDPVYAYAGLPVPKHLKIEWLYSNAKYNKQPKIGYVYQMIEDIRFRAKVVTKAIYKDSRLVYARKFPKQFVDMIDCLEIDLTIKPWMAGNEIVVSNRNYVPVPSKMIRSVPLQTSNDNNNHAPILLPEDYTSLDAIVENMQGNIKKIKTNADHNQSLASGLKSWLPHQQIPLSGNLAYALARLFTQPQNEPRPNPSPAVPLNQASPVTQPLSNMPKEIRQQIKIQFTQMHLLNNHRKLSQDPYANAAAKYLQDEIEKLNKQFNIWRYQFWYNQDSSLSHGATGQPSLHTMSQTNKPDDNTYDHSS